MWGHQRDGNQGMFEAALQVNIIYTIYVFFHDKPNGDIWSVIYCILATVGGDEHNIKSQYIKMRLWNLIGHKKATNKVR